MCGETLCTQGRASEINKHGVGIVMSVLVQDLDFLRVLLGLSSHICAWKRLLDSEQAATEMMATSISF